jgi:DNA polymerase III psi subunit
MSELEGEIFNDELYSIRKKPIIIINQGWSELDDIGKELLSKIINSLRISIYSVNIISTNQNEVPQSLYDQADKIVCFGLVNDYPLNQVIKIENSLIIYSQSLIDLQNNDAAKNNLWNALKTLFYN